MLIAGFAAFFLLVGPSSLFMNSDPSLPWNEQKNILKAGQTAHFQLSEEQPQLTHALRYKTGVEQDGQSKGNINFLIYPDGIIKGVWNGEYDQSDDVKCLVMAASFIGNIDPSRRFIEDGKYDPSRLYFITAGTSTFMETNLSTGQNRSAFGFIYVRGWLDPNYTIVGELITTKDKKTFETFSWEAVPVN